MLESEVYKSKFVIVLGDDWMALYDDGVKVLEAKRLTFSDILEACGISYVMTEADLEWCYTRNKEGLVEFPNLLEDVPLENE